MKTIPRRAFLQSAGAAGLTLAGLGSASAMQPLKRPGAPALRLSLAAYSFRKFFAFMRDKAQKPADGGRVMDMKQFIDFCADHGCLGTELTSYFFTPDAGSEYFLELRRHAFLRGVEISGTAVGNTFTYADKGRLKEEIDSVKAWIDKAAVLGAPHIRVFAGRHEKGSTLEASRATCIGALEECCEYAGSKGVFLGLENHGGIVEGPDDLLTIVKAVDNPWFGVNLDTGNFRTEDPYKDLERCAPYAINVQVKVEMHRPGQGKEEADLPRLFRILRQANYQGYVVLEYEAATDPYQAVPPLLRRMKTLCEG